MGGCLSVLILPFAAVAAAGFALYLAILGGTVFCLALGIILLIVQAAVLKKRTDTQTYRILRIVCIATAILSLLAAVSGIFVLAVTYLFMRA